MCVFLLWLEDPAPFLPSLYIPKLLYESRPRSNLTVTRQVSGKGLASMIFMFLSEHETSGFSHAKSSLLKSELTEGKDHL